MGKVSAMILLSFIGLCTLVSLSDACNCMIKHPQQRFCDTTFSFVGILDSRDLIDKDGFNYLDYTFSVSHGQIFKGRKYLTDSRDAQHIFTPYYGNLCGRPNLDVGTKYLVSGSVEGDILSITYCDWVKEWSEITEHQKSHIINGVYAANCDACQIPGSLRMQKFDQNLFTDYVNPLSFSGLWTPRACYYNPLASLYYRSPECETDIAYCAYDEEASMCLWQSTTDYNKCFTEREATWQLFSGFKPAFTSRSQCREISNRTLKKKCKRAIKKQRKARLQQKKAAALEAILSSDSLSVVADE